MRITAKIERKSWTRRGLCTWAAGSLLLACGGVESDRGPHLRSMAETASAASAAAKARDTATEPAAVPAQPKRDQAPRFSGVQIEPAGPVPAGVELRVSAHAVDPEGQPVRYLYSWTVNGEERAEPGPRFDTSDLKQGDLVRVSVVATDGWRASTPMHSPALLVKNNTPIIHSRPRPAGPNGEFRYQIEAEGPDTDSGQLSFQLLRGPEGMQLANDTGLVVWQPSSEQNGLHPVALEVSDAAGASTTQSFVLQIEESAPPAAPAP